MLSLPASRRKQGTEQARTTNRLRMNTSRRHRLRDETTGTCQSQEKRRNYLTHHYSVTLASSTCQRRATPGRKPHIRQRNSIDTWTSSGPAGSLRCQCPNIANKTIINSPFLMYIKANLSDCSAKRCSAGYQHFGPTLAIPALSKHSSPLKASRSLA